MEFAAKFEEACLKDDRIFIAANIDKLLEMYRAFKEKLSGFAVTSGNEEPVVGGSGQGDK